MAKEDDIRPDVYTKNIGQAIHELDQQKQSAIDIIKNSEVFTVSALNKERTGCEHITFVMHEKEFVPFLTYSSLKIIEDLTIALNAIRSENDMNFRRTVGYLDLVKNKYEEANGEEV